MSNKPNSIAADKDVNVIVNHNGDLVLKMDRCGRCVSKEIDINDLLELLSILNPELYMQHVTSPMISNHYTGK